MAVSSSMFGFNSVEFECLWSSRKLSLSGFGSSACLRQRSSSEFLVLGRKSGFGVKVQRFRVKGELNVHKEAMDVVSPKESEGVASLGESVIKGESDGTEKIFAVGIDTGNGGNSFGDGGNGNGGRGGGDDGSGGEPEKGDDHHEAKEFGPILKFEEVMRQIEARGAKLPVDMLQAAKTTGIREIILSRYLDLQGSFWPLGAAIRSWGMLRNRMLADPAFLFKISTEIVIDSCCATLAEVQKRGENFWQEFELYLADLIVGTVVNVALVGMLAPYVRFGHPSMSKGFLGQMQRAYGALPSSVFEAERPGCHFSVQQRIGTYFFKGIMYGSVGFACGLIGQGIANLIMTAKRQIKSSENDVPVPPLIKSAALWGVFLAVSSNTRYQIVNGLERLVEASPLARQVPPVALAFTVGVRFANNVYGGMQFVDWARWSGCQ